MKYAILSDIHANLPALEAVLADVDSRDDVDAIFHLGDLVGYAPWPDEVVDLLRARAIAGVAGNYDSTVATDYAHCGCRYEDPRQEELSHLSYEWTRRHVGPATRRLLAGLVRVAYDVERAARAIRESDLPDDLADQLAGSSRPSPSQP